MYSLIASCIFYNERFQKKAVILSAVIDVIKPCKLNVVVTEFQLVATLFECLNLYLRHRGPRPRQNFRNAKSRLQKTCLKTSSSVDIV